MRIVGECVKPGEFLDFLRRIEAKWQKRWEDARIFEADAEEGKRKYFLTVPYPYTSGPLHIGHGRTYTIGDVYARFMRMRGYHVLWPMAFHISGTPIASISARIARGEVEARELYKSYVKLYVSSDEEAERIVEKFSDPKEVARFFSSVITEDFKSLGFSIDWRRRFTTGDPEYQAFITWQYLRLNDHGVLKRGKHPILFCTLDKQAVGEDDIKGGDEFRPGIAEYTAVKFSLNGKYLVAATFRPETVFGVTNVWVNPDATYVEAEVDGEVWIVSKESAEKLAYQSRRVKVLREFPGRELVGLRVKAPLVGRVVPVLPAEFVNPDEATGVVYSVPAHAPYDYAALVDVKRRPEDYGVDPELVRGIEPISIIAVEGFGEVPARDVVERMGIKSQRDVEALERATQEVYKAEFYGGVMKENCGEFAGLPVSEAKERVKKALIERGEGDVVYETSPNPMYCRCGGRVVVAVLTDQWFINYGDPRWKELAWECLNSLEIIPEKYRKFFEDTFNWLQMRPVARKRGLGTPLPFDREWVIESLSDSTIYTAYYTIAHIIRREGIRADQLKPEVFDYVFYGRGSPEEVSEKTGIPVGVLEEMRREFTYWYPNDHRHTGIGHISNHLSFYIFHHALLFPREHWPRRISLNEFVIREGAKMSKSKGNVIPLVEVPRRYSADLFRLYVVCSASLDTVMDWREAQVSVVLSRLRDLWTAASEMARHAGAQEPESVGMVTRWFISRVNSIVRDATRHLERMEMRDYAIKAVYEMLNLVEKYRAMAANAPEEERAWAEGYAVDRWVRLIAPIVPHLAEEIWSLMGRGGFVSLARWPEPEEERIDEALEAAFKAAEETIEDIKSIARVTGKAYTKARLYVGPPEWKYRVVSIVVSSKGAGSREVISKVMSDPELRKYGKKAVSLVQAVLSGKVPWVAASRELELEVYRELKPYIERETGLAVEIHPADNPGYDPAGKAKAAQPFKPGIYLE